MKKIFSNFNKLPKGLKRLLISGTLVGPFLLSPIILFLSGDLYNDYDKSGHQIITGHYEITGGHHFLEAGLIIGIPLYWLMVLLFAWTYDGYKSGIN